MLDAGAAAHRSLGGLVISGNPATDVDLAPERWDQWAGSQSCTARQRKSQWPPVSKVLGTHEYDTAVLYRPRVLTTDHLTPKIAHARGTGSMA